MIIIMLMNDAAFTAHSYAEAREALLARIRTGLQNDPRCVAAWLLGSYGRGEQDWVSDIDLCVVMDDPFAGDFCIKPAVTGVQPAAKRMELFRSFGEPANIHENHNNAPEGGTFSCVLYRDPPVIVDWTILPRSRALRPMATLLLFDRVGIQRHNADRIEISPGQGSAASLLERVAFFWMMAAVTAKYLVRGKVEETQGLVSFLEEIMGEIERFSDPPPQSTDRLHAHADPVEQIARLRQLCDRVEALKQQAPSGSVTVLRPPREQVEAILRLSSLTKSDT